MNVLKRIRHIAPLSIKVLFFPIFFSCLFLHTAYGAPHSIDILSNNSEGSHIIQTAPKPLETKPVSQLLTQLRFIALSLNDPQDINNVLVSLIKAHLILESPDQALDELKRITLPLQKAQAQWLISQYYLSHKDKKKGIFYLEQAAETIKIPLSSSEKDDISQNIAISLSHYNLFPQMIATIEGIHFIEAKITTLSLLKAFAKDTPQNIKDAMKNVLDDTSKRASKHLSPLTVEILSLYFDLSHAQSLLKDYKGAQSNLNLIKPLIQDITDKKQRSQYETALALALTHAKDNYQGINILKSLPTVSYSSWGIASVAYFLGKTEGKDNAIPLFKISTQQAKRVSDTKIKYLIYRHIISGETKIGLLADAYSLAGEVRDRQEQAKALYVMASELLKQNKVSAAKLILDHIPYMSMRIPIFFYMALEEKQKNTISKLLLQALTPVNSKTPIIYPNAIPESINAILELQYMRGSRTEDQKILQAAQNIQARYPGDLNSTRLGTYIAQFLAHLNKKKEGNIIINQNWSFIWLHKKDPDFALTLSTLVKALIALNRPYQAFNVATQIPVQQQNTRFVALTNVAAHMAAKGNINLALRAVNYISNSMAQAHALSKVIIAFADNVADAHDNNIEIKEIKKLEKNFLHIQQEQSFTEKITPPF